MPLRPLVCSAFSACWWLAAAMHPSPSRQRLALRHSKRRRKPESRANLGLLPAYQRELSGTLQGVPAGAEVELALLVIDDKDRPQQLLASSSLIGTNQVLPFHLRFNSGIVPGRRPC